MTNEDQNQSQPPVVIASRLMRVPGIPIPQLGARIAGISDSQQQNDEVAGTPDDKDDSESAAQQ
jgi:hypothetical protein